MRLKKLIAITIMVVLVGSAVLHVAGVYGFVLPFIWPAGTSAK